jgi:hypothetical protein
MTRYERRMFFERLVELRAASESAGDDDRISTISIEDAIAEAEAAFALARMVDETEAVDQ